MVLESWLILGLSSASKVALVYDLDCKFKEWNQRIKESFNHYKFFLSGEMEAM